MYHQQQQSGRLLLVNNVHLDTPNHWNRFSWVWTQSNLWRWECWFLFPQFLNCGFWDQGYGCPRVYLHFHWAVLQLQHHFQGWRRLWRSQLEQAILFFLLHTVDWPRIPLSPILWLAVANSLQMPRFSALMALSPFKSTFLGNMASLSITIAAQFGLPFRGYLVDLLLTVPGRRIRTSCLIGANLFHISSGCLQSLRQLQGLCTCHAQSGPLACLQERIQIYRISPTISVRTHTSLPIRRVSGLLYETWAFRQFRTEFDYSDSLPPRLVIVWLVSGLAGASKSPRSLYVAGPTSDKNTALFFSASIILLATHTTKSGFLYSEPQIECSRTG